MCFVICIAVHQIFQSFVYKQSGLDACPLSAYICFMQVDDALINKLSRLAMLDFDAAEKEEIKADLEKMIGFVDKLKELDTTGIEPLLHITSEINVLREDVPGNMITKEEALQNAALHNQDFFLVPKVIKKDEA